MYRYTTQGLIAKRGIITSHAFTYLVSFVDPPILQSYFYHNIIVKLKLLIYY